MANKPRKKKSNIWTAIALLLLAAAVLGIFFIVNNPLDDGKLESDVEETEYAKIINRDMEKDYPYTVREVAKYYCRIMKCMMNGELSEEEFENIFDRMRMLFDDQLLSVNPREVHLLSMKSERDDYIKNSIRINGYVLDSTENIREKETKEGAYAYMSLYFTVTDDTDYVRVFEDFVFRKDDNGNWKILGWQKSDKTSLSDG